MKDILNISRNPEPFFLPESEREKGVTMTKRIKKIDAFDIEFKKPEFARPNNNIELFEDTYSKGEENSFDSTNKMAS